MKTAGVAVLLVAAMALAVGCGKGGGDTRSRAPRESPAPAPARGTATPAAGPPAPATTTAAPAARDACALLSVAEAAELTGIPVDRVEKTPEGCAWYGNAAARQQKGQVAVSGTLEKPTKQEPASAEDAARSMETMLKGLVGAAAPGRRCLPRRSSPTTPTRPRRFSRAPTP